MEKAVTVKFLCAILIAVLLLAGRQAGFSQEFVNLNFESANVSGYSSPSSIPTTNAIPGWTAYIGGTAQASILYNNETLGAASVSLQGTNGDFQPIQGNYFVLLLGTSGGATPETAGIGQTGQIPALAESLVFWANITANAGGLNNNMQVTFDNQLISYSAIGSGPNYTIYGADISVFAGDTGQLLFTALNNAGAQVDNIQFSTSPIPEPSELALLGLGAILFALCRRKGVRENDITLSG